MRALLALLVSTCLASAREEAGPIVSRHGVGHDSWHAQFYSKLVTDDGGSCCNFNDCRPTLSRSVGNHYEVLARQACDSGSKGKTRAKVRKK
jgi:hypothetical protein